MAKAIRTGAARYLAFLVVGFIAVATIHVFIQSTSSAEDATVFATPRLTAECLDCHEAYDVTLALSPHQLAVEADAEEPLVACSDCHPGDPRHYEDDPETYSLSNPSKLSAAATAELCSSCHMNSHQQNMLERNVHLDNGISCTNCHKLHDTHLPGLLQEEEPALCIECHTAVEGEFAQPFRHPVNDGIVKCSDCHATLDLNSRDLSLNGTGVCTDCHMEFQGPFPYEHQASVDYSTEEGGCLTCHAAHGSSLPRMLTQPYEPPHFQLCSQCHSVPLHNDNAQHGTAWSTFGCNDCHTDIHGSYTSRNFLSETLEGEGCFNVGCHRF